MFYDYKTQSRHALYLCRGELLGTKTVEQRTVSLIPILVEKAP
jgi:hypothetical protein